MFLRMTNTVILVKNYLYIKKDFKIHDGRQFWPKIVISMKSTNMPVSILPKPESFKVLCAFIANYGVNNEKSEIHGLPGVLKMLTLEKKQKSKINHFRKTALIYHRFILFNSKSIINKTPMLVLIVFFVCFSYANTTQFRTMK